MSYFDGMESIVSKAREFAMKAHAEQRRNYSGVDYFTHLERVANLVTEFGGSDDEIAAAYLHDVLEDTPTKFETLVQEFGSNVARLVLEVTDISKPTDGNRKVRKAMDKEHLANASIGGQLIKLADSTDNISDIRENSLHSSDAANFAPVFFREKKELLQVLTKGNDRLWALAWKTLNEATQEMEERNNVSHTFSK